MLPVQRKLASRISCRKTAVAAIRPAWFSSITSGQLLCRLPLAVRHTTSPNPGTHLGTHVAAAASQAGPVSSAELSNAAVFLELEGAVIDMHMDGHRQAFNAAFQAIGYDCIQWPPHIYSDLLAAGDGSAESIIYAFFNIQGWPTMLATSDQPAFVSKVHHEKQAALTQMLQAKAVPLRAGVAELMAEVLSAGAQLCWITNTCYEASDLVVANALAQLPADIASRVRVFASGVVAQQPAAGSASPQGSPTSSAAPASPDGLEERGPRSGGCTLNMEELLRQQQGLVKQEQARQFVAGLRANGSDSSRLAVDPSLLSAGAKRISSEWLAAVTATLDTPLSSCAVLAASSSVTEVAAATGMLAVAVPRKMAERGMFAGAKAKFPGYGPGEATWGRVNALIKQHAAVVSRRR